MGICDGISLVLGILGGERTQYFNVQGIPRPVPAQFSFITEAGNMKRGLFIWVKFALKSFLEGMGFSVDNNTIMST